MESSPPSDGNQPSVSPVGPRLIIAEKIVFPIALI